MKGVTKVFVLPYIGFMLNPPTGMGNRYAYVIASWDNPDMAKELAKRAAKEVKFHLEPIKARDLFPIEPGCSKEQYDFPLDKQPPDDFLRRAGSMKSLRLSEFINIIGGTIVSRIEGNPLITHVVSRKSYHIRDGTLIFFPHKSKLIKKRMLKSCVIVTDRPDLFQELREYFTIIAVKNSKVAFDRFIKYYRSLFPIPVVGITGTTGKTTTKEMVAHILEVDRNVVKTIASHNDRYRNLSYLMRINDETDAAVIEVGIGAPGGIESFDSFFKPKIGVITNIDVDHGSGFVNQQAYINEKAKMVEIIDRNEGAIILNNDDVTIQNFDYSYFKGKMITFAINNPVHVRADHIQYDEAGMRFTLYYRGEVFDCSVKGFGKHNVYNALAALAVSASMGIPMKEAIKGLRSFQPLERPLQIRKGLNQCTLIDDTWNTNAKSIEAALEVLTILARGRKTIAVLGEVEELGHLSESEHKRIGTFIHKYKIDTLVTVGKQAKYIAQEAQELGMDQSSIFTFEAQEGLVSFLKNIADSNSIVLIKASMRNSFEGIMEHLVVE